MRLGLVVLALLATMAQASALCRCACVRGTMRPICQDNDLVTPICAGLCTDELRRTPVVTPLGGGQQVFAPVQPFNPAPNGVPHPDADLNTDTRGFQLGSAGVPSGTDSLSSRSTAGAAAGR